MNRRYADPHLDPMRAPTAAGQHPHTGHDDRHENPQHMYESREAMTAQYRQLPRLPGRPLAAAPAAPAPSEWWENPLVVFGLGTLAVFALHKLTEDRGAPRRNPGDPPAYPPPAPPVVVLGGSTAPAPAQTIAPAVQALPEPAPSSPSSPAPAPRPHITPEGIARLRASARKQPRGKGGQFKRRK